MNPPTNFPMEFPSCSSNFPPSPTNQLNPGSCANAPIAATTKVNSAIKVAIPTNASIA